MKTLALKNSINIFALAVIFLAAGVVTVWAQNDTTMMHKHNMGMMHDSSKTMSGHMMNNQGMMSGSSKTMGSHMMNNQGMMSGSSKTMGSHMMNNQGMMNHNMMDSTKMKKNPMVREGVIDLKAIDKNKDGKVFQDMMDWNVISDKAGKCPLCGMTLKEVTLDQAAKNLTKFGYKVKK